LGSPEVSHLPEIFIGILYLSSAARLEPLWRSGPYSTMSKNAPDAVAFEAAAGRSHGISGSPAAGAKYKQKQGPPQWTLSSSGSTFCFSRFPSPTSKPATRFKRKDHKMLVDYILGGGVTLFLLVYLTYALVRPERF
jgi:K+-transporting ATPase KdpF subunit